MDYHRLAVLNLYKSLLRYGNNITLTDKEFYLRVIRQEFKKHSNVAEPEERSRLIQVIFPFSMCFRTRGNEHLINKCSGYLSLVRWVWR